MSQFQLVFASPRLLVVDVEAPFLSWRFVSCHLPSVDDYTGRITLIAILSFHIGGRRNFTVFIDANSRLDLLEACAERAPKKYVLAVQQFSDFVFDNSIVATYQIDRFKAASSGTWISNYSSEQITEKSIDYVRFSFHD